MIVDGANLFTVFRKLIMFLAAPGIAVTSLLSFLFAWNEYLLASTLTMAYARTIPTIDSSSLQLMEQIGELWQLWRYSMFSFAILILSSKAYCFWSHVWSRKR